MEKIPNQYVCGDLAHGPSTRSTKKYSKPQFQYEQLNVRRKVRAIYYTFFFSISGRLHIWHLKVWRIIPDDVRVPIPIRQFMWGPIEELRGIDELIYRRNNSIPNEATEEFHRI